MLVNFSLKTYWLMIKTDRGSVIGSTMSSLYRVVKRLAARISLNEYAARKGYHNSCVSPEYAERVANFVLANRKVADAACCHRARR